MLPGLATQHRHDGAQQRTRGKVHCASFVVRFVLRTQMLQFPQRATFDAVCVLSRCSRTCQSPWSTQSKSAHQGISQQEGICSMSQLVNVKTCAYVTQIFLQRLIWIHQAGQGQCLVTLMLRECLADTNWKTRQRI